VFCGLLFEYFDLDQRRLERFIYLLVLFLLLSEVFFFLVVVYLGEREVVFELANQIQVSVGDL
jgi:hypothetical protein